MAEIIGPPTPQDYAQEYTRAWMRAMNATDSGEEIWKAIQALYGYARGTDWLNWVRSRDDILPKLKEMFGDAGDLIGAALDFILSSVYGVNVIGGSVGAIAKGGGEAGMRIEAGRAIIGNIFGLFNIDGVRAGYQSRQPGAEEQQNFARFVGMNWQIQMADLIAEFASHWIPGDIAAGSRSIGDKVGAMLGLEDAQEEIMQPLMEKFITEGLGKRFNRETMPTDLSPSDAVQAFIQELIPPGVMKLILDNEGVRPDIREALIQLRAKNLTEADFRDLYQRGTWTQDQVFKGYRGIGYLAEDATLKTALLTHDRAFALRTELLNVKESQFVHGVLDENGLRSFLATLHFTAEEEDLEIEIAKGKASMGTAKKPKAIAGTFNVAPWRVKPGASAVMSWNIRNAENVTISGMGSVDHRGERVIQPDISQTYILTASSDTDTERFEAVVQVGDTRELKRPTASLSASPGKITIGTPVELKWITNNADSVSIDQVGPVAESGAMPVFPFLSTIYTLRARNAQGETIRQDIVFVDLPDADLGKEQRPGVAFAITPGVVKTKQPQTELTWTLTRAESGTLTFPDGSTKDVGRNGALIVTVSESGIFTLKATNIFGTTQNQQAVIFEAGEEETPPPPPGGYPPTLMLLISPITAKPSEILFINWSITGADVGTLILADGTTRQVGASGNQNTPSPAVAGTYEYRLQAENAGGPASQSVVVVVSATQ